MSNSSKFLEGKALKVFVLFGPAFYSNCYLLGEAFFLVSGPTEEVPDSLFLKTSFGPLVLEPTGLAFFEPNVRSFVS
jgi:hypothetical protein